MAQATTAPLIEVARAFFDACETGKGWEECQRYCAPDATFSAQAEPLADLQTLQQYTDWMKGILTPLPDGRYEVKSFAADDERSNVIVYGIFSGTHTGEGGPCPPTGRSEHGLRIRDGLRGRPHSPHDEDLELGRRPEATRLGVDARMSA
jgi:predicted ester cyclase